MRTYSLQVEEKGSQKNPKQSTKNRYKLDKKIYKV